MNEQITPTGARTTQFADGLPRRSWTVAEFEKLATAGIFTGNDVNGERLELLGGEIVPMSPKGPRHEVVRTELTHFWYRSRASTYKIANETPLTLGDDTQPEPDLVVFPADLSAPDLTADAILLVVEVADTSYDKDTQTKAQLYASAGIQDYWVINAATLVTTIFRNPSASGFQSRTKHTPDQTVTPLRAPELALALNELGLAEK